MKNSAIFCLGLLVLLTIACKKDEIKLPEAALNTEITIDLNEEFAIETTNFSISFIELLEDSRCPPFVDCIWEGRASVKLLVIDGEVQTEVELRTKNGTDGETMLTATYENYTITLVDVQPIDDVPESEYSVTIKVVEN